MRSILPPVVEKEKVRLATILLVMLVSAMALALSQLFMTLSPLFLQ